MAGSVPDPVYRVYIVRGSEYEEVLSSTSARKVRHVAQKIKERPGRRVEITRDGKALPGGRNGLDRALYYDRLRRWDEEVE